MWGRRFHQEPAVTETRRTYWFQPGLDDPDEPSNQGPAFKPAPARGYTEEEFVRPERQLVTRIEDANLVSSFTERGLHKPVIDLDVPARLVPSKTPGHFHLYIDVEMEWDDYSELLWALAKAGIVEQNYVAASNVAGMSFVRTAPDQRPERDARQDQQTTRQPGGYGRAW